MADIAKGLQDGVKNHVVRTVNETSRKELTNKQKEKIEEDQASELQKKYLEALVVLSLFR